MPNIAHVQVYTALTTEVTTATNEARAMEARGDFQGALQRLQKLDQYVEGFLSSAQERLKTAIRCKEAYEQGV